MVKIEYIFYQEASLPHIFGIVCLDFMDLDICLESLFQPQDPQ